MQKSKLTRWSLMGSAAILAMAGATTSAQAYETKYGDVQIVFDTTVSMGMSMLTQDRNTQFLPEANGGPVDPRADGPGAVVLGNGFLNGGAGFGGLPCVLANTALGCNGVNLYSGNLTPNFDGSINGDDGRLNFDRGDLIGANVKASHDLQMTWQNYKLFARAVGFYDVVMNDQDAGSRSQLTDAALGDVGRNYELLDLFISADYTIAELPVNLRAGKQVINWGESTFLLNGLNVFNPIDVASFRRPGSEIKEALVPVNALFASVSFPFDVSLAGYYALDWEPFEIDPSGTPFSGADVVTLGSGLGGNSLRRSFVTASPFSANRRNCIASTTSGTNFVQISGLLNDPTPVGGPVSNNDLLECLDEGSIFIDHTVPLTIGQHELIRLGQIDGSGGQADLSGEGVTNATTGLLLRSEDHFAKDSGQYGIKATWFAESLNGSEFGFYYQNYHSRLPFVSIEAIPTDTHADLGFFLNGASSNLTTNLAGSLQSRQLNNAGCGITSPFHVGSIGLPFADLDPGLPFVVPASFTLNGALATLSAAAQAQMKGTPVSDPGDILGTANAALVGLTGGNVTLFNAGGTTGIYNQFAVAQLNCVLTYYQSGFVTPRDAITGALLPAATTVQSFDGAEFLLATSDGGVALSYPEDIEVFGFSFNTTVGSWGLQGEMSYRPSAPFQVDTDTLTIASLVNGCVFTQLYGAAGTSLGLAANPDGTGVKPFCGSADGQSLGVLRNEMFTAQIGTTATFTGSEWFIDAIGADLGILVSEVGMVYVPSVEDTWIDNLPAAQKASVTQYANTGCQGTDLPLAGALNLDVKSSAQCRPTDVSAGLVLLFSLQYNNFMDTGFILAPTLVYSWDFEGTTPSPYGNYAEDRQAISLGATGTLNNNFRIGVNYNSFFGGHVNNKSRDRDFASITASYSF